MSLLNLTATGVTIRHAAHRGLVSLDMIVAEGACAIAFVVTALAFVQDLPELIRDLREDFERFRSSVFNEFHNLRLAPVEAAARVRLAKKSLSASQRCLEAMYKELEETQRLSQKLHFLVVQKADMGHESSREKLVS
jgi:hypothetical protein